MCVVMAPATMAAISMIGTAVSTGMSMVGQMQQGRAAAAQASYQAAVGRNNAILAQRAATDARLRGEADARKKALETKSLIGRQRVALAANGVVVDQDTALELTEDTAAYGKLDALTIRSNAEREALGYEAQGTNFNAAAQLQEQQAKNARSAGVWGAVGTALGGAASLHSKWYQFNDAGTFAPKPPTYSSFGLG